MTIERQNRINRRYVWRNELMQWLMFPVYLLIGVWLQREYERGQERYRRQKSVYYADAERQLVQREARLELLNSRPAWALAHLKRCWNLEVSEVGK